MEHILLIVHVFIALALIGVVLVQRSDSDGFGLGSGSGSNFLSGRQTASLLTRTTAILATIFILNSLVLSVMAANRADISLVDQIEAADRVNPDLPPATEAPAVDPSVESAPVDPAAPAVPVAE